MYIYYTQRIHTHILTWIKDKKYIYTTVLFIIWKEYQSVNIYIVTCVYWHKCKSHRTKVYIFILNVRRISEVLSQHTDTFSLTLISIENLKLNFFISCENLIILLSVCVPCSYWYIWLYEQFIHMKVDSRISAHFILANQVTITRIKQKFKWSVICFCEKYKGFFLRYCSHRNWTFRNIVVIVHLFWS